ncbi:MAG: polysaccharide export protein [Deltaproteobacteria bacterium RBG_13_58_19]|jgi:protein involved in polysaccharide export with SLBB domain|nr:MAG: polysaccharide export protein [Deltaproteobacteria bacterium RBG_13_58_19]
MTSRKFICLLLILLILFPAPGWGQLATSLGQSPDEQKKLEEQAQFYLQKIGPQPTPVGGVSGQLPPQQLKPQPLPTAEPAKMLTTAPRQPEETSAAERRAAEYGLSVKQYGYSFFYKPPETFLPVQSVPVGPDYTIGPGDSIKILIWGSVQGEYSLTVDNNGQIAIPKVGAVHVSGLTYRQLREVMDREFARLFNNFQMNVTLDNLRTIPVYVVGQARFPGSYAVSSLSTLISALFAAGGPSKSGSMRDIQVRRGKSVIVHFDMYDFLLRGDKSRDIRLQPQDVIFIPPIGPLAAIGAASKEPVGVAAEKGKAETVVVKAEEPVVGGPIKVPGIFELKDERTLTDLLNLGGGLADTAFKGRVQVLRVQHHQQMVLFEDDLDKVLIGKAANIPLVDGDFVKIFHVPDKVEKKVRLAGAVKKPGEFGLHDRMRVKDLIAYAGGLLMEANQQEAEVTRVTITQQGPETSRIYINLRQALNGAPRDNLLLNPNDYVFIRSIPDWALYRLVKIEGEVKYPGNYAIKKGETLSSLLSRAGGFSDSAYSKGAFFTRVSVQKMQAEHMKQAIDKIEAEMLSVAAGKTQTALEKEDVERQKTVLVQQQQFLAKLKSIQPLGRVVIRIDDPERLRGTSGDLELQEGDSLLIPQIQQTVNVLGSVVNPTAVVYDPYLSVKEYIAQVGGPTNHADLKHIYVIKVNGSALSGRGALLFGGGVASARLDPGDTIVVPEDLERVPWLKTVKDISTILGNFALMAGVIFAAIIR